MVVTSLPHPVSGPTPTANGYHNTTDYDFPDTILAHAWVGTLAQGQFTEHHDETMSHEVAEAMTPQSTPSMSMAPARFHLEARTTAFVNGYEVKSYRSQAARSHHDGTAERPSMAAGRQRRQSSLTRTIKPWTCSRRRGAGTLNARPVLRRPANQVTINSGGATQSTSTAYAGCPGDRQCRPRQRYDQWATETQPAWQKSQRQGGRHR